MEKPDAMMLLYSFPGSIYTDKTPYDYITDKKTGMRKTGYKAPNGTVVHNIATGIEGVILPPLAIWSGGKYINQMTTDGRKALAEYVTEQDEFQAYAVTGEGTPGDYICRIYILPMDIATDAAPKHPLQWPDRLKKGTATTKYTPTQSTGGWGRTLGTGYGSDRAGLGSGSTQPAKPATPAPPKKPEIPASIRLRCGGCGHWYRMSEMGSHAEYCCPGINGDDVDWALPCECCDTLDECAEIKPGFPRESVVKAAKAAAAKKKKEEEEVKKSEEAAKEPAAAATNDA